MYAEAVGFDSLGVGGAHGDATRKLLGSIARIMSPAYGGVFYGVTPNPSWPTVEASSTIYHDGILDSSRGVPTAAKNPPRAWGALACVYLGHPAS